MPARQWTRDNDTEIWEYTSFRGEKMLDLAHQIANSKRAVVRFNGDQFYSDHVITSTEKRVIRDMFLAFEYLESR